MRAEIEADERQLRREKIEIAKRRLQQGRKVFRYKMVFLPTGDLLDEDPMSEGFDVPTLSEFGLEGWEGGQHDPRAVDRCSEGRVDEYISGVYFLMKKEISADEASELEE